MCEERSISAQVSYDYICRSDLATQSLLNTIDWKEYGMIKTQNFTVSSGMTVPYSSVIILKCQLADIT